jgi:hypothetical protein
VEKYRWWFLLFCPVLIFVSTFCKTDISFNLTFLGGICFMIIGILSFPSVSERHKGLLVLFGFLWVVLTLFISSIIPSRSGLGFPAIRLAIAGIALFSTGVVNYFLINRWLKILLAIVLTPVIGIALFFLMWGLNTGFQFTM